MPLPVPIETEDKETFIKRFMSDDKMIAEYPDETQRMAVANTQWESVDRYNAKGVTDGLWMCSNVKLEPTENKQWIKVFPRGKYYIDKYKKDIDFDDKFFGQIAEAFDNVDLSKPKIDKDHKFENSFGDIFAYKIKDDGMYFEIELSQKGVDLVKTGEYDYVSPAWGKTKDTGKKTFPNRLLAISLTNFPALEGANPALRDQLRLSKFEIVQEKKEEANMDLYVLANELGLNKDASVESVLAEVKTLKTSISSYELGMKDMTAKCKSAEDTAIKLSQELKEVKSAELKKEAFDFVKKSIELGKVHPAVQDIVIERYCLNKDSVIKEMDLIPEKVYNGKQAVNSDVNGLSKEVKDKMLKAGLDVNDKEDIALALSKWGGAV